MLKFLKDLISFLINFELVKAKTSSTFLDHCLQAEIPALIRIQKAYIV